MVGAVVLLLSLWCWLSWRADDFNNIVGVNLSAEVTDDFFWSGELLFGAVDDFFESGIF